ncbi:uncharacterized protein LOC128557991 [Mercenaria mercenaria]|uniref:uncharacterized protein LOC128557991 n=1 Tax=Mercenaria mercenaria TaxID=6596 RepID=UPI00234F6C5D|nr:uncharacterized protein LOC128557991 [Mercenaria mercenaria]
MQRDVYVDNVLSSFQLQVELLTYFREARSLMSKAGMNLRSWTSNSAALRSQAAAEGVLDNDEVTKVLGMRWEPVANQKSFARREIPLLETVTKRTILRYSSRIYDPLGLLSPVTVRAKLLLQELWKLNYDWDIPLSLTVLANDLNTVTDVKFSRKHLIDPSDTEKGSTTECDTYLHIFVDASTKSYGATAYICNKSDSKLVMAKNRVAPLKFLTLPQLELLAALVGARLATHLHSCLNVSDVTFWSDSQIVLYWLNTNRPLKRFVQNRVIEIQSLTPQYEWKYCPRCDNPADLLTRGISTDQFISNNLWETGPTWILEKSRWPRWEHAPSNLQTPEIEQTTFTEDDRLPPTNIANLQCTIQQGIHDVIDIERYSSYRKLLRVTAYVLRYISNCKKLLSDRQVSTLSVRELCDAEKKWLLSCQAVTYSTEISEIQSKMTCRSPIIRQLRLFLDDYGLIRCNGRIHNASLADVTKFLYLLPKKHPLTRLIVTDAHENQLHSGINSTVTQLRQKYWIPAIRQCAKSVLRKCVICRRVTGRPYTAPDTLPLPKIRVKESPPFSVTAVDFTGALYVKDNTGSEIKVYICLFTCAVTRAVHLEVVPNLSEDSCLQAFRRFASRKSMPQVMISDNAATYLSASNYLKRMFEYSSVMEMLNRRGIEWKFIPSRAPWYGGFWERLIGLTKTTFKKILGKACISFETLQTIVTEIEAIMNDRPLTYISSNFDDPEPSCMAEE